VALKHQKSKSNQSNLQTHIRIHFTFCTYWW